MYSTGTYVGWDMETDLGSGVDLNLSVSVNMNGGARVRGSGHVPMLAARAGLDSEGGFAASGCAV